jgi:hypothetical protein
MSKSLFSTAIVRYDSVENIMTTPGDGLRRVFKKIWDWFEKPTAEQLEDWYMLNEKDEYPDEQERILDQAVEVAIFYPYANFTGAIWVWDRGSGSTIYKVLQSEFDRLMYEFPADEEWAELQKFIEILNEYGIQYSDIKASESGGIDVYFDVENYQSPAGNEGVSVTKFVGEIGEDFNDFKYVFKDQGRENQIRCEFGLWFEFIEG